MNMILWCPSLCPEQNQEGFFFFFWTQIFIFSRTLIFGYFGYLVIQPWSPLQQLYEQCAAAQRLSVDTNFSLTTDFWTHPSNFNSKLSLVDINQFNLYIHTEKFKVLFLYDLLFCIYVSALGSWGNDGINRKKSYCLLMQAVSLSNRK